MHSALQTPLVHFRPHALAALALTVAASLTAHGQSITPTYRTGTSLVSCGDIFAGPRITHTYTTGVDTHDSISVNDNGGGFIPISSAACTLDAVFTPSSLSLATAGSANRGDIPPGGSGSASSSATTQDQWNFTLSQTTCFTFDGTVSLTLSTGGLTTSEGFQIGIDGSGAFTLADGSYRGLLSAYLNQEGSATVHYSGTMAAGSYFMTISGAAEGNGAPRYATFNTFATLTLGGPAGPSSPAPATVCSGQAASFSITPVAGATYQWQIETAPDVWQDLTNDLAPLPCGGSAHASPPNSPSVEIRVQACPGQTRYQVRCLIANSCGSTPSAPATLAINSADFNGDGDTGTDADIEAFFACLSGACCPMCGSADFNGDGDIGTDSDIEAFFRVLSGGAC